MTTLAQQAARGAKLRAAIGRGPARHTHALRTRCEACGGAHTNDLANDIDSLLQADDEEAEAERLLDDLIASPETKFKPIHRETMRNFGIDALRTLRDKYLGPVVNVAVHVNADDPEVVAMGTHLSASSAHDARARENAGKLYQTNGGRPFVHATPRYARTPAPPLTMRTSARGEPAEEDELAGMNFEATNHAAMAKHGR